jgi:hypothetical protein
VEEDQPKEACPLPSKKRSAPGELGDHPSLAQRRAGVSLAALLAVEEPGRNPAQRPVSRDGAADLSRGPFDTLVLRRRIPARSGLHGAPPGPSLPWGSVTLSPDTTLRAICLNSAGLSPSKKTEVISPRGLIASQKVRPCSRATAASRFCQRVRLENLGPVGAQLVEPGREKVEAVAQAEGPQDQAAIEGEILGEGEALRAVRGHHPRGFALEGPADIVDIVHTLLGGDAEEPLGLDDRGGRRGAERQVEAHGEGAPRGGGRPSDASWRVP